MPTPSNTSYTHIMLFKPVWIIQHFNEYGAGPHKDHACHTRLTTMGHHMADETVHTDPLGMTFRHIL